MDLKTANEKMDSLLAEMRKLREEMAPFEARFSAIVQERQALQETRGRLRVEDLKSRELTDEDWKFLLSAVGGNDAFEGSQALLRFFNDRLYELGGYHNGYNPDTGQAVINIMTDRNSPESAKKAVSLIRKFKPLLIPVEKDGPVRFGVYDAQSDMGGPYVHVNADETCSISPRWRRYDRLDLKFDTLEELTTYLSQNHWSHDPAEES